MTHRTRLSVQPLENRWCPALTAALRGSTLVISGTADNGTVRVVQDSATAGTFTVSDGDTAVSGGPFTGVTSVRLNLTDADDKVSIDLGGQTLAGGVTANLGGGANDLTVSNGEIGRQFFVSAGDGDDTVTLGDGSSALTLRDAQLALDGGLDTVSVAADVTVSRTLATFFANTVSTAAGSTVGNLYVRGGTGGNTVSVAGDVIGTVAVDAAYRRGTSTAGTTVSVSGEVGGDVLFAGTDLADSLTVTGAVSGGVAAALGDGADTFSSTGGSARGFWIDAGAGDDIITLGGAVGGRVFVNAGAGNDSLTIDGTAAFSKSASISMGAGDDTVTVADAAILGTTSISGGVGSDTFVGTRTRTGLTLVGFEL